MAEIGRGLRSGVKPDAPGPEDGKGHSRLGRVLSAIIGCIWAGLCLLLLVGALAQGTPTARFVAALLLLLASALALPWTTAWLRKRAAFLRPTFVPPSIATVAAVAGLMVNVPPSKPLTDVSANAAVAEAEKRPKVVSLEETLAEARKALDDRDHDTALALLTALPARQQTDNLDVVALQKRAFALAKAAEFPAQVRDYWLPEIAALKLPDESEDIAAVWSLVQAFDNWGREIETGAELPLDGEGKAALAEARASLSRKQGELFPALRRLWREKVAHGFWLMDIEVAVSGASARTVTWTGALFAANANIQSSQTGFMESGGKLRFASSRYRWFSRADRITSYDMKAPSDQAIGYWNSGTFVPVD